MIEEGEVVDGWLLEVEEGVVVIEARCGVGTWRLRAIFLGVFRQVGESKVIVARGEVAIGVGGDRSKREIREAGCAKRK